MNQHEYNLNTDRCEQIKRLITEYTEDKTNEMEIVQIADIKNILKVFREMYKTSLEQNSFKNVRIYITN